MGTVRRLTIRPTLKLIEKRKVSPSKYPKPRRQHHEVMRLGNERNSRVRFRSKLETAVLACMFLSGASSTLAQQKGQWVPGQFGLNAGVIPDPGITYANMPLNYSASQLNDPNGNRVPSITGTYSFWVDENIFYYVPKHKFLGGYFMPYIVLTYANGELVADITGTNLSTGWRRIRLFRYVRPAIELGLALKAN